MVLADFVKGMVACLFTSGGLCVAFYAGDLHGRGLLGEKVSDISNKIKQLGKYAYNDILVSAMTSDAVKVFGLFSFVFCFGMTFTLICQKDPSLGAGILLNCCIKLLAILDK